MSDIAELMSRDPLSFTKDDEDFRAVVEKIRSARGQYNLGSMKAGKVTPPKTPRQKAVASIGGLGLSGSLQAMLAGKKPEAPKEE